MTNLLPTSCLAFSARFLITAGLWVAASNFVKRQSDLVSVYADEMTYHLGDEREMQLCHREYTRKLGPGMYRNNMYKVRKLQKGGDIARAPLAWRD